jgi:hypothetical protein
VADHGVRDAEVIGSLARTIAGGYKLIRPVLVRLGRRVMTAERWVELEGWEWLRVRGW